jgi:hypothetical protein
MQLLSFRLQRASFNFTETKTKSSKTCEELVFYCSFNKF